MSIIFLGMGFSEALQYFALYAFGVTFDPWDIVAFGAGTLVAIIVDLLVFTKVFSFWEIRR